MASVCLQKITSDNCQECISLRVEDSQVSLIATNAKSLAEASVNSNLVPLAIYDGAALGYERPTVPMVGFTMYELAAGVGFIARLMIDQKFQRKGYGRATTIEVIRRLKLHPEVQLIGTSHRRENRAAGELYRSLGFVSWEVDWAKNDEQETYLMLRD